LADTAQPNRINKKKNPGLGTIGKKLPDNFRIIVVKLVTVVTKHPETLRKKDLVLFRPRGPNIIDARSLC
jgi:hypothetical protein